MPKLTVSEPDEEGMSRLPGGGPRLEFHRTSIVKLAEGDGVRVLTRVMKTVATAAGEAVQRPSDSDLLTPSIEKHRELLGRVPDLATADAGFFSAANEAEAKKLGVKRVAIPSRSTKSDKRKQEQKKPWFKKAQKWRTGCEGRISVLKRRHGLNRSHYKGVPGLKRWVGLGVIADNVINIGLHLASKR